MIHDDPVFTGRFAVQDVEQYSLVAASMGRTLIDRDTALVAEPEDVLLLDIATLIIPGVDASHAT